MGNIWTVMKKTGRENIRKIVFVVVNAESKPDSMWDKLATIPSLTTMLSNYSNIAISRYNRETMAILEESFSRWENQIRNGRCAPGQVTKEPGSCGDIKTYMVDVRFENIKDKEEADYLSKLPTAFRMPDEDVDRLKAAARRLVIESGQFQKLLKDLSAEH